MDRRQPTRSEETQPKPKELTPVAALALAEAQERRQRAEVADRPPERGGRQGPDPIRYGDWEVKGIASDF